MSQRTVEKRRRWSTTRSEASASTDHEHRESTSRKFSFRFSAVRRPLSDFFSKENRCARKKHFLSSRVISAWHRSCPLQWRRAKSTTGDRDRMTRIGFAYNQKPDASTEYEEQLHGSNDSRTGTLDDETSSFARTAGARTGSVVAVERAAFSKRADDVYAEWDSPETIAAVERALSALGDVVRLEATPEFPQRLREARPDIVFNMAEGFTGQNREAHVPAICEFYGIPYSGSDPFTLSLALNKARAKQMLDHYDIPTAPFALVESLAEAKTVKKAALLRYPLFAK